MHIFKKKKIVMDISAVLIFIQIQIISLEVYNLFDVLLISVMHVYFYYIKIFEVAMIVMCECGTYQLAHVCVSPCGRYIVSIGGDGSVCVWDVAFHRLAGMETRSIQSTMVRSFHFTIKLLFRKIVSHSFWRTANNRSKHLNFIFNSIEYFQGSISFSRDGGSFAVSHGGPSVSIYSLDNLIAATSTNNSEYSFDPKFDFLNNLKYLNETFPLISIYCKFKLAVFIFINF
uniref:WD_REPEATS_REGION domain-containing protein n=1 Tax=Heterorhabditis bacteriophora TaxID=37862 RepID=A0A1I7X7Y3_HETBA